jgi:adenylate cyclase
MIAIESAGAKRRLAAILVADVVGYSRLMSEHEERTLNVLNERLLIFKQLIPQLNGRIFGGAGDSVIAEFPSAVDVVRCAVELQQTMALRNAEVSDDERMQFRIGLSVGDVIVEDDNLMGECVNIASRLEGLAEPGCIALSADVYHQVRNKVQAEFQDLGPQALKNIPEPIHTYQVIAERSDMPSTTPPKRISAETRPRRQLAISAAIATLAVILVVWYTFPRDFPAPHAENPSILVLPFANISDDPDQEYFVDGISQDIITDLSRLSNLKVIAWNTSTSYKGKNVQPQEVGGELGVSYVLNGNVRKSGDHLRITAQLVDAHKGNNIWAERYDRKLTEIFELQDEVTKKIVNALAIRLTKADEEKLGHPRANNIEAYDAFLRGQQFSLRRTKDGNELARDAFRDSIELDPTYARAYGALAVAVMRDVRNAWTDIKPEEASARALELAQKAVTLDRSSPQVYWALGYVYLHRGQYDEAAAAAKRAIELAPNYADGYGLLALVNNYQGRAEEAVRHIRKAMALNPYYTYEYPSNLGRAYYILGRYPEALDALIEATERNENAVYPRLFLAAAYVRLGQQDDAEWEIEQTKILNPGTTLTHVANTFPMKNKDEMNAFLEDLRKAGLSD